MDRCSLVYINILQEIFYFFYMRALSFVYNSHVKLFFFEMCVV